MSQNLTSVFESEQLEDVLTSQIPIAEQDVTFSDVSESSDSDFENSDEEDVIGTGLGGKKLLSDYLLSVEEWKTNRCHEGAQAVFAPLLTTLP